MTRSEQYQALGAAKNIAEEGVAHFIRYHLNDQRDRQTKGARASVDHIGFDGDELFTIGRTLTMEESVPQSDKSMIQVGSLGYQHHKPLEAQVNELTRAFMERIQGFIISLEKELSDT